ncbi:alpha/beta fold hydrolase [Simkania sp.]|uniref:alpha/beta fold hydrolase n=1 Tax=Simkania sp. TaxID=34094 RepID=UPI003B528FD2
MPTIELRGKTCFYQDRGEGYPLLLGHSFLWDSAMWQPQIEELSKHYRCIVPDLWSHGQSDPLSSTATSIDALADDYWELMQALKISEFALIGLSVGGMWGTLLTLKHPEAVKALVLMDTFVGSEPTPTQQKYFGLLDLLEKEKAFTPALFSQVVPLFFSPTTLSQNPTLAENFHQKLSALSPESIEGMVTLGRAIFSRPCLLDQLADIQVPALVIVGQDDIPRPPSEAREMNARVPNCSLKIVPEAGHICNLEKPAEVTSHLTDFLQQHLPVLQRLTRP